MTAGMSIYDMSIFLDLPPILGSAKVTCIPRFGSRYSPEARIEASRPDHQTPWLNKGAVDLQVHALSRRLSVAEPGG